jgi:hypothetical protein
MRTNIKAAALIVDVKVILHHPALCHLQMPAAVLLVSDGDRHARRLATLDDRDDLIRFGLPEIRIHELIAPVPGRFQDGRTPISPKASASAASQTKLASLPDPGAGSRLRPNRRTYVVTGGSQPPALRLRRGHSDFCLLAPGYQGRSPWLVRNDYLAAIVYFKLRCTEPRPCSTVILTS